MNETMYPGTDDAADDHLQYPFAVWVRCSIEPDPARDLGFSCQAIVEQIRWTIEEINKSHVARCDGENDYMVMLSRNEKGQWCHIGTIRPKGPLCDNSNALNTVLINALIAANNISPRTMPPQTSPLPSVGE